MGQTGRTLQICLLMLMVILCHGSQFQKLGILVRYQKGNMEDLQSYLNNLMIPSCEVIQEINLILSHEAQIEYHSLETQLTKYQETFPINFYNATQSQAEFRFRIPQNSKADLYYTSSIFFNDQNCESIRSALKLANEKVVNGLFGLVGEKESLNSIQADLRRKEEEIFYYDKLDGNHFCIVEDIRVIPRHILELSQSSIKEVTEMANQMRPYCEEVFLNFVSSHFYPQLRPSGETFRNSINVEIDEYTEYDQKNYCIRKFIDILGYLPLFYQRKDFTGEIWINPNLPKVIELKRQQIIMAMTKQTSRRRLIPEQATRVVHQQGHAFYQQVILNVLWGIIVILAMAILIFVYRSHKLQCRIDRSYLGSQ